MDEVARLRDSARASPLAKSARQHVATCHQAAVLRRERRAAGLRACDRGAQFTKFSAYLFTLSQRDTARWAQRRQSWGLRHLPRRLARRVPPRRAAHRRAAAQQLVVPRLRHRGGDAGRLKFGIPRSFFAVQVVTPERMFFRLECAARGDNVGRHDCGVPAAAAAPLRCLP